MYLRESRQLDDGESLAISVKFLPVWDRQSQGWMTWGKRQLCAFGRLGILIIGSHCSLQEVTSVSPPWNLDGFVMA